MQLIGPFHPQIVHFPVALLILSLVFDVVGRATDAAWWRKASLAMLVVAVLSGVAAFLTGEFVGDRAERLQGIPEATVDAHGDMGKTAVWLAGGALVARLLESRPPVRAIAGIVALLLQLASAVTVGIAAHRGGRLVYDHGANVRVEGKLIHHAGGDTVETTPAEPPAGSQPPTGS